MQRLKRWGGLPYEQKRRLLLEQTEWALFTATVLGINIDKRSLSAVVEARRLYCGGRPIATTKKIIDDAIFVESHLVRGEWLNHNGDIVWSTEDPPITAEFIVAYMCAGVILHFTEQSDEINKNEEIVGYLIPLDGTTPSGPLARWFIENVSHYALSSVGGGGFILDIK